jgi:hypothetical protein
MPDEAFDVYQVSRVVSTCIPNRIIYKDHLLKILTFCEKIRARGFDRTLRKEIA